MADSNPKREKGVEIFKRCYGSALMEPPPEGSNPFFDIMLEGLFGSVWAREEILSLPQRRLFTMGIIAAMGESEVYGIQVGCALRNNEMTVEQVRELIIQLAPYAGYPRVNRLVAETEKVIAAHLKELKAQAQKDADKEQGAGK
jgi:4-carboxymuconolactone decarboxylase